MKPLVIYHANCVDGFTAAWIAHQYFGPDGADYHAANYGQMPPADLTGRQILIVDFSYPLRALELIAEIGQSVLVLDHHKTAEEDLKTLRVYDPTLEGEPDRLPQKGLWANFDMKRSGAGLAWDYLFPRASRPAIVDYVEDRDLWRFKLKNTRAIHATLASYPFEFGIWKEIALRLENPDQCEHLAAEGRAIDRRHLQMCNDVISSGKHFAEIGGYTVPICNAPFFLASDVGNIMSKDQPFAATFQITSDGSKVYSLRTQGKLDVSEVAKKYGGGGHAKAAGFKIKLGGDL